MRTTKKKSRNALTPLEPKKALLLFCDTVEAAGGVTRSDSGLYEPVGDPKWVDLGEAYFEACCSLGRKPLIIEE